MRFSDTLRKQDPGWRAAKGVADRLSDTDILETYARDQTRYAREQKEVLWIGMGVLAALSAVVMSVGVAGLVASVFN